jgi:DNA polymerase-3 subunit epsilon
MPFAGRRRPWRSAAFAALDFETTGLDYDRDAIVSFGIVPVLGGRVVLRDAIHQLVVPHVPASPRSMTIHHILPRDLAGAPELTQAREVLRAALDARWLLAWYAQVEVEFLSRIFRTTRRRWAARTIDVRKIVLALDHLPPETRNTLSSTAQRYGVPVESPHDALDDALVTAQLFLVVASRLERDRGVRLKDLLRLAHA